MGEANGGEPRVAGRIMCELKDDIDFFKRPEGSFRIEEIDQRKNGKVSDCEDDPSAIEMRWNAIGVMKTMLSNVSNVIRKTRSVE